MSGFSGVGSYDILANEIGEDVSPIVTMISPEKVPFLNSTGMGNVPIFSPSYEWSENRLLPDTYVTSSAIASNAGAAVGIEVGADADLLRVNDIMSTQIAPFEQMNIVSIGTSAATIYVQRAYAGTAASSLAAGGKLDFYGSANLENAPIRDSRRILKDLKRNYIQTIREDLDMTTVVTNTQFKAADQPDAWDEEIVAKTIEVTKQLEKFVLMGRTNGNTVGTLNNTSTMAGIYHSLTTNTVSHATYSNSILNNMLSLINDQTDLRGETGNYMLYPGNTAFRKLSNDRNNRVRQTQTETVGGLKMITVYDSDFGPMPVTPIRWIPDGSILCLRRDFVKVRNFAGNSFAVKEYFNGEMVRTGYVGGRYGLEFNQEKAHGKLDGIT